MIKTGNPFTDYLFTLILFLPLIPVLLIFGRKLYLEEPLHFLTLICLLGFLNGIQGVYPLASGSPNLIHKIFSLLLFLLLFQSFSANLVKNTRWILTILLAALLSGTLTYWSVKGWTLASPESDTLLNISLVGVIALSGPALIRSRPLQIFQSPLFWMEAGTLFYILLSLLMEWIGPCCQPDSLTPDPEKRVLLNLADGLRWLFYTLAVLSYPGTIEENRDGG